MPRGRRHAARGARRLAPGGGERALVAKVGGNASAASRRRRRAKPAPRGRHAGADACAAATCRAPRATHRLPGNDDRRARHRLCGSRRPARVEGIGIRRSWSTVARHRPLSYQLAARSRPFARRSRPTRTFAFLRASSAIASRLSSRHRFPIPNRAPAPPSTRANAGEGTRTAPQATASRSPRTIPAAASTALDLGSRPSKLSRRRSLFEAGGHSPRGRR